MAHPLRRYARWVVWHLRRFGSRVVRLSCLIVAALLVGAAFISAPLQPSIQEDGYTSIQIGAMALAVAFGAFAFVFSIVANLFSNLVQRWSDAGRNSSGQHRVACSIGPKSSESYVALARGLDAEAADSTKSLGDIALARSDHEGARAQYEAALPLYRRAGGVQGEPNCSNCLADIALARSAHEGARAQYEAALALYERIGEPSIGRVHMSLALVAESPQERQAHFDAARAQWMSIDRPDLIARLDELADGAADAGEATL